MDIDDKTRAMLKQIEQEFRASLEEPEMKAALERAKLFRIDHEKKPKEQKEELGAQAFISPEIGIVFALAVIGIYVWLSRRK